MKSYKNTNLIYYHLKNIVDTGRGASHTGVCRGEIGEGQRGVESWGVMPDIGDGEEGSKSHCHVCTYATILHVLHMYPQT